MKSLFTLFVALFLTSFIPVDKTALSKRHSKWVVTERSTLSVNGSTNVSKFCCVILEYPKTDTVSVLSDNANNTMLTGAIKIEVKNFDCNNYMMTKELRKTLKENQYPQINIKFLSLKEVIVSNQKTGKMKGSVEINITGVSKRFEVVYELSMHKDKLILIGNQPIKFSDFKLIPPKRMGKLIRAKDELIVAFTLKMELAS